jgi:hypothetical protein
METFASILTVFVRFLRSAEDVCIICWETTGRVTSLVDAAATSSSDPLSAPVRVHLGPPTCACASFPQLIPILVVRNVLTSGDLLGAVGDTSSWAGDTVGMVDKHADKDPALGTHTVAVAVDLRDSLAGHGAQDAEGVGHRGGRSWNKADSSYGMDQDMVEILVPYQYDTEVPGLKPNYNTTSIWNQNTHVGRQASMIGLAVAGKCCCCWVLSCSARFLCRGFLVVDCVGFVVAFGVGCSG